MTKEEILREKIQIKLQLIRVLDAEVKLLQEELNRMPAEGEGEETG